MTVTVTGKLNKPANEFQAGESTGFGIRLGERYYDRETGQNEWTNYECAVFAKNPKQIEFYRQALVEGSVIQVSGDTQKVKQFNGNNGQIVSIEIHNAKLGPTYSMQQPQQTPAQGFQQPQGGFNQQPPVQGGFNQQNAPAMPTPQQVPEDWDSDVPF